MRPHQTHPIGPPSSRARRSIWKHLIFISSCFSFLLLAGFVVVSCAEEHMMKVDQTPHRIHVSYGVSMHRSFWNVRKFVKNNFRNVVVTGSENPNPPLLDFCLSIFSVVQVAAMALILVGPHLFTMVGFRRVPAWYYKVKDYGLVLTVAIFWVMPQILRRYSTMGPFEIIYLHDDAGDNPEEQRKTLWSRLETGGFPNAKQLTKILEGVGIQSVPSR